MTPSALLKKVTQGIVALLAVVGLSLAADTWRMPTVEDFFSANRSFRLRITPAPIQSQLAFWEDGPDRAHPGQRGPSAPVPARAVLGVKRWWGYRTIRAFDLVNPVAPVDALVSDDGSRIVTFDDWHSMGFGSNVVVLYDHEGRLVRKLALADFLSPGDIDVLPRSASSIWWSGRHEIKGSQLTLKVVTKESINPSESRIIKVPLDLTSGAPLEPIRDRISPGELASVAVVATTPEEDLLPSEPHWWTAFPTAQDRLLAQSPLLSSSTALRNGAPFESIPYPAVARAARVHGRVVVDLLVDGEGKVLHATGVSGPPLLRNVACRRAETWRFRGEFMGAGTHLSRLVVNFGFRPYQAPTTPGPQAALPEPVVK